MRSTAGTADVYDTRTIALHWVTVAFVCMLWIIGQCIDFFPKGVPRMGARAARTSRWACSSPLFWRYESRGADGPA